MYKYEELNDQKKSRPFPLFLNSTHEHHNQLTDLVCCIANDRSPEGKTDKESDHISTMSLEMLVNREQR